jgi:hypothetical protein
VIRTLSKPIGIWKMLGLRFYPEAGSNTFLKNDDKDITDYIASHPRRQ